MLGICRISFTTAGVDYMSSVGLIYCNVNVRVVCVCVSVLLRYLSPILQIWFILSRISPPPPPPPHPHTHKEKKEKKYIPYEKLAYAPF